MSLRSWSATQKGGGMFWGCFLCHLLIWGKGTEKFLTANRLESWQPELSLGSWAVTLDTATPGADA